MAWLARELQIFSKWVIQIFSEKMVIAPMPKLSVIVPVYNTEKYLRECIDSILAQTFTDFELILVDDGSTDKSGAICDEYCRLDDRIRVIHQNNGGVTVARKRGVELSSGEYVTFVDSDDWIDPNTYSDIMYNIEIHNADIGIFAILQEESLPKIISNCVGEGVFSKELLRDAVYQRMLFDYSQNRAGVIPSLCNKIAKRAILQKSLSVVPNELDYGEDAIAGYVCILNASTVYISNDPFYHYRDNPLSVSHADSSVMKKRILALDREMRSCLSGYNTDMTDQISGHIARHTVEQVRNDLLYTVNKSFYKRWSDAGTFCVQPQIAFALEKAYPKICNKKEKIKVLLIRYRLFCLLHLLFRKV